MKKFWIAAFTTGLLAISAVAQTPESSSASGNASVTPGQTSASQSAQTSGASANANTSANAQGSNAGSLSGGTVLQAQLSKSVDAKKAKSGDEVTAKLTQDVKADGKVIVQKGAKLVGHVTEAQAKTKENPESKLGVIFNKAVLKNGQEIAFNGVIVSFSAPVETPSTVLGGADMDRNGSTSRGGGIGPTPMGGAAPAGGSPVGGAGRTVENTTAPITNAADGAVNNAGAAATGGAHAASAGLTGMEGVGMTATATGAIFHSSSRNIKLDSGSQMVLQVAAPAAAK
ncbi:MAG TPA: hypothetical protein VGK24_13590 [Candidatus Angelobacter sp.]|jgi:hypothetical protein